MTVSHPNQQSRVDNVLINGGMRVNQRGGQPYNTVGFTFDKWELFNPGVVDVSQDAYVGQNAMLVEDDDTNNSTFVAQFVEDALDLQGKTVTFAAKVKEGPNTPATNCMVEIWESDGTNTDSSTEFVGLDGSYAEVDVEHTVSADATELEVRVYAATGSASLDASLTGEVLVDACTLTVGEFPVEYQPRPIGMERSLCERYYETFSATDELVNIRRAGSSDADFFSSSPL